MPEKILSVKEFSEIYARRHPEQIPSRSKGSERNWFLLAVLFIALLAVNILSGAHTIPVIQSFYPDSVGNTLTLIGVSGFIGIEGFMFLMMAREKRTIWAWLVIVFSFAAALAANLSKTLAVASDPLIGFLLGAFAPLSNLSGGEVFREERLRVKRENGENEREYQEKLGEYQRNMERAYRAYLTRVGVAGEEEKALFLSGREGEIEEREREVSPEIKKSLPLSKSGRELAERMRRDGTENESYSQLNTRYGASNNTISAARKILKQGLEFLQ